MFGKYCKAYLTKDAKQTILKMHSALCNREVVLLKNRIKELRKQKKMSQEDLALEVGTTRQTITSIEVEKYTASLVLAYKIARFFQLSIEEVFDFTDEE